MISVRVMASIGVARIWIQAVPYRDQTKRLSFDQPIRGARRRWTVVTKLMPVRIEENPRTKAPERGQGDVGRGYGC